MLAVLLNVPQTDREWEIFSLHHQQDHEEIRQAIQVRLGVNLPSYVLAPVTLERTGDFLENNQHAHTDMNGALGLNSSDIQTVDLKDPNQLASWVDENYQEHYSARQALSI